VNDVREEDDEESRIEVFFNKEEDLWVCEFTTTLPSGKVVPRAMKCRTQDELIKRMSRVHIGRVNKDTQALELQAHCQAVDSSKSFSGNPVKSARVETLKNEPVCFIEYDSGEIVGERTNGSTFVVPAYLSLEEYLKQVQGVTQEGVNGY
jgi:hypothetical protein